MTYSIGQVAEKMNITTHTLRYYDKEGLLPFVNRSESGIRIFKESDFEWLFMIECLKKTGMPIKDIKQFIDWCMEGESTIGKRLALFEDRKATLEAQIAELQEALTVIEYKKWIYETASQKGSLSFIESLEAKDYPQDIRCVKDKISKLHEK